MKPFIGELQSGMEKFSCRRINASFNYHSTFEPAAVFLDTWWGRVFPDVRESSFSCSVQIQIKLLERLLDAVAICSF